jgi:hypothetical protein
MYKFAGGLTLDCGLFFVPVYRSVLEILSTLFYTDPAAGYGESWICISFCFQKLRGQLPFLPETIMILGSPVT